MVERDKQTRPTLCWDCKNACGGCSWSAKFEPVPGWKAVRKIIRPQAGWGKGKAVDTYRVDKCPLFEPDEGYEARGKRPREPNYNVADLLSMVNAGMTKRAIAEQYGVSVDTVFRRLRKCRESEAAT